MRCILQYLKILETFDPRFDKLIDVVVDFVNVCGRILPGKQAGSTVHRNQRLALYREDDTEDPVSTTKSDEKGDYCFSVKAGRYAVVIKVEESRGRERTLFFPKKIKVQLENTFITGLEFR